METMMPCLTLSFSVKSGGGSMMGGVTVSAARLALGDERAAALVKADVRLPSKPAISKSRLIIDGALMRWKRTDNRPSTVRYLLADSSPQAKHDWMMSECFEIQ